MQRLLWCAFTSHNVHRFFLHRELIASIHIWQCLVVPKRTAAVSSELSGKSSCSPCWHCTDCLQAVGESASVIKNCPTECPPGA